MQRNLFVSHLIEVILSHMREIKHRPCCLACCIDSAMGIIESANRDRKNKGVALWKLNMSQTMSRTTKAIMMTIKTRIDIMGTDSGTLITLATVLTATHVDRRLHPRTGILLDRARNVRPLHHLGRIHMTLEHVALPLGGLRQWHLLLSNTTRSIIHQ